MRNRFFISVLFLLVCSAENLSAREDSVRVRRRDTVPNALFEVHFKNEGKPKKDNFWRRMFGGHVDRTFARKVDYSVAAVPTYTKEGSFGLGAMGAAMYRLNKQDSALPVSDATLRLNASLRGFLYAAIMGNTYFPDARSRLSYEVLFRQQKLNFWGTNYDSCMVRTPTKHTRWSAEVNAYYDYEVLRDFYIGAALQFAYIGAVKIGNRAYLEGERASYITTGLGFTLQYDSRDFGFSPTRGFNIFLRPLIYPGFLGNAGRTLWRTTLNVNYFQWLWRGGVLAFDLFAEFNSARTPWVLREAVDGEFRFRGYYFGRYVDNNIASFQVELRQKLFWRVGLVVFAGCGTVFSSFRDWSWGRILPTYGVGLRFEFKQRLNVRLDYGVGRGTSGVVFAIGESF